MTFFNSDDFGITLTQAEHILQCRENGRLTGISAMPNAPLLEQAMAMVGDDPAFNVAVHLNVTEGLCLSAPEDVPLLAGPDGRFRQSFFQLLVLSLGPERRQLRQQLIHEFTLQMRRVLPLTGGRPIRLDGHQHIQMIPGVLAAIRDMARQSNYELTYIRWPREPLWPFLRHVSLWRYYRPVNLVKNLVLNLLALPSGRILRQMGLKQNMAMGLMLSGHMAYEPVRRLLPELERIAARRGVDLEVVIHPGWGVAPGQGLDVPGGHLEAFQLSPGRKEEYDCLMKL